MIVADSSFIAEGILTNEELLKAETILAPDLAIYETASAIWKHQVILSRIRDGTGYLSVLAGLLGTHDILTVDPDEELVRESYDLAVRYGSHLHDAVFVALAVKNGLSLHTFDLSQQKMYEQERKRRGRTDHSGPRRPAHSR